MPPSLTSLFVQPPLHSRTGYVASYFRSACIVVRKKTHRKCRLRRFGTNFSGTALVMFDVTFSHSFQDDDKKNHFVKAAAAHIDDSSNRKR